MLYKWIATIFFFTWKLFFHITIISSYSSDHLFRYIRYKNFKCQSISLSENTLSSDTVCVVSYLLSFEVLSSLLFRRGWWLFLKILMISSQFSKNKMRLKKKFADVSLLLVKLWWNIWVQPNVWMFYSEYMDCDHGLLYQNYFSIQVLSLLTVLTINSNTSCIKTLDVKILD